MLRTEGATALKLPFVSRGKALGERGRGKWENRVKKAAAARRFKVGPTYLGSRSLLLLRDLLERCLSGCFLETKGRIGRKALKENHWSFGRRV